MAKPLYEEPYELIPHDEPGMRSTLAEVDFTERVIGFDETKLILDFGCNVDERSLELFRRGYLVVGLDRCELRLEMARKRAEAEHLSAQFTRGDAHTLTYKDQFDVALLLEHDVIDWRILTKVGWALKLGGMLILTLPNSRYGRNGDGLGPPVEQIPEHVGPAELAELLHKLGFIGIEFFTAVGESYRRYAPVEDHKLGVIAVRNN